MDFLTAWTLKTKSQKKQSLFKLVTEHNANRSTEYIRLVSAGRYGVYASMGPNFAYAIFGRDSIEVAEDLLTTHKHLVRDIIFTLARLQGVKDDNISEEEPGKIHHEYRSRVFDGEVISEESLAVMHNLQRWWGGIGADELVYYGSFDATPLYMRLVYNYTKHYGIDILDEKYIARDGKRLSIRDSIQAAANWLTTKIESSPLKLLEYKRINPNGIKNQVWKDSETSYLHLDGSLINTDNGVAALELQGYAYDALLGAANLLNQKTTKRYLHLAKNIQTTTIDKLWIPEDQFFAQGLDRTIDGESRQIKTLTSNAGLILHSQLIVDLPEDEALPFKQGIVKMICSPEFLTDAGLRCRALKHHNMPGFVDYHGTYAVWPKETFDIASGFRRNGYAHLARQLTDRILHSIVMSGDFYEFFYVDIDGKAWYDQESSRVHFKSKSPDIHLSVPEPGQAWVISAVINILNNWGKPTNKPNSLESQLLDNIVKLNKF